MWHLKGLTIERLCNSDDAGGAPLDVFSLQLRCTTEEKETRSWCWVEDNTSHFSTPARKGRGSCWQLLKCCSFSSSGEGEQFIVWKFEKEWAESQGREQGSRDRQGWKAGGDTGGTGEPPRVILDLSLGESKGSKGEPLTKWSTHNIGKNVNAQMLWGKKRKIQACLECICHLMVRFAKWAEMLEYLIISGGLASASVLHFTGAARKLPTNINPW